MAGSGDILADRRYAYAEAALRDGEEAAAADMARQALELAPGFAPAWLLLGQANEALFRAGEAGPEASARFRDAVSAYETARALDPEGRLGAGLRLAALGVGDPDGAMAPGYVRALFDDYAIRFDRHLVRSLKYRAPDLLHEAVRRACSRMLRPFRFAEALDLGCGTGLAGERFRAECARLSGVDLSPAMLAKAEAKRVYDEVEVGDVVGWLAARPAGRADLVLAADVLVYLGDLAPVFAGTRRALGPDGLFAFTVQSHAGEAFRLGEDLRYAHAANYVRETAAASGFDIALLELASTREDRGEPVPGLVGVLSRP